MAVTGLDLLATHEAHHLAAALLQQVTAGGDEGAQRVRVLLVEPAGVGRVGAQLLDHGYVTSRMDTGRGKG